MEPWVKLILQNNVELSINNKLIKSGVVRNITHRHYNIVFNIFNKNKERRFELPTPFNIVVDDENNLILFDYRIVTIARADEVLREMVNNAVTQTPVKNRYLGHILQIHMHYNVIDDSTLSKKSNADTHPRRIY